MPPLSKQQSALVEAKDSTFAEACPGAGKTRAIVARFQRRVTEEPRKGIALISFTNGAIDEVRKRCGERADALLAPHFAGTFDGFINRFITRPLYVRQYGQTPRFSESWAGLKLASFRVPSLEQRMSNFKLDWFELDWCLRATLKDDRLPYQAQWMATALTSAQRTDLEREAARRCRSLVNAGTVSCAASQALAAHYLRRGDNRELFGTLLAARFSEVIVDEAQDCGPAELSILELLKESGVGIIAVADLDQSIFEFRRAEPAAVRAFAASLDTHLTLDGNYRSSPAICAVNNSLRDGGRKETPQGDNADYAVPVQLLGFDQPQGIAAAVEVILKEHDLTSSDVIFLAHRASDARSCADGSPSGNTNLSDNKVLALARACAVLRSVHSGGRDRLKAAELVERTLRQAVDASEDDPRITGRWLRDFAVRLAITLDPAVASAQDFAQRSRESIKALPWPSGVTPPANLGQMLRAPDQKLWQPSDDTHAFRSATIHSVKGQEFPGVVVVFPKAPRKDAAGLHVLDHWENGVSTEPRRVLYVGASRAQRLLIIAAHNKHVDRVAKLLAADGVPHVRA
jgi:superfamily I DNA/RNA helicase